MIDKIVRHVHLRALLVTKCEMNNTDNSSMLQEAQLRLPRPRLCTVTSRSDCQTASLALRQTAACNLDMMS